MTGPLKVATPVAASAAWGAATEAITPPVTATAADTRAVELNVVDNLLGALWRPRGAKTDKRYLSCAYEVSCRARVEIPGQKQQSPTMLRLTSPQGRPRSTGSGSPAPAGGIQNSPTTGRTRRVMRGTSEWRAATKVHGARAKVTARSRTNVTARKAAAEMVSNRV